MKLTSLSLVFCISLFIAAFGHSARAQDSLYRLRFDVPVAVPPSAEFDLKVLVDHSLYPAVSTDKGFLSGFFFGVEVPSYVTVVSASLGDSVLGLVDTARLEKITIEPGLVSAFASFKKPLAAGLGDHILTLRVRLNAAGSAEFKIAPANSGELHLHVKKGALEPKVLSATVLGLNPLLEIIEDTDESFPLPGADETTPAEPESSGGTGPLFAGTQIYCNTQFLVGEFSQLEIDGYTISTVNPSPGISVPMPPMPSYPMSDIQTAVNAAIAAGGLRLVIVGRGEYTGNLKINISPIASGSRVILASESGPENTILNAAGVGVVVHIFEPIPTPPPGGPIIIPAFSFGYTTAKNIQTTSPYPIAAGIGWSGFTVQGGANSGFGAGIVASTQYRAFEIRGNYIRDNGIASTPTRGGGIYVDRTAGKSYIFQNDIAQNLASEEGGGIHFDVRAGSLTGGSLQIEKNFIYENAAGQAGGGLFLRSATELCSNDIYSNESIDGCGAYLEIFTDESFGYFFVLGNEIYLNKPNQSTAVAGIGGGLALVEPDDNETWELGFIRNRIYRNGKVDPFDLSDVGVIREGGGLYLQFFSGLIMADHGVLGAGLPGQIVANNAIYENRASEKGGGIYSEMNNVFLNGYDTKFYWNSVFNNQLTSSAAGANSGAGVYFASLFVDYQVILINGCIIRDNFAGPLQTIADWYAEDKSGVEGAATFSWITLNANSPVDIDMGQNDPSTQLDVVLDFSVGVELWGNQLPGAATIDGGQPSHTQLIANIHYADVDFVQEPRVWDNPATPDIIVDIGADEYHPGPILTLQGFVRGDVNLDSNVNIADPVFLLNALFVGGAPAVRCEDAADVNDDGGINISDPVALLNALFVLGTPPLAEPSLANCGDPDPTADALGCVVLINPCP